MAGLLSVFALVTGVVLAVLLPGLRPFPSVCWWLLIPCVAWDLCSLQTAVSRVLRGHGPSTVPLVAWGYYVLFCLFGMDAYWWWRLVVLAGLTLFHACCHDLLPAVVQRHTGRRPRVGP